MKNELQEKLYSKYPKLFKQKNDNKTKTAMCWGIAIGDGWYDLIDNLCDYIDFHIKNNDCPQIEFSQVKQKFGTLRAYYDVAPPIKKEEWKKTKKAWIKTYEEYLTHRQHMLDKIGGAVGFAESLSGTVCEVCGSPGELRGRSWVSTLCEEHKPKTKIEKFAEGRYNENESKTK